MLFLKLSYHINAAIKKFFLKGIYSKRFVFGEKFTFRKSFEIMIGRDGKVKIGDNCFFNNYCSIFSNKKIKIGNGTIFGENVKIYDHNHRFKDQNVLIKNQGYSNGEIFIGDNCWIGSNVTILKGAKIGNNCVIGAGCIIKGEVPNCTIVVVNQELSKTEIINKS